MLLQQLRLCPGGAILCPTWSDDISATERAICVRPEPSIDAANMKSMAAFWKQPQGLAFPEIIQANRALRSFDQPLPFPVLARCNRIYDRLLQAHRCDKPDRVVHAVLVQELLVPNLRWGRLRVVPRSAAEARLNDDHVIGKKDEEARE